MAQLCAFVFCKGGEPRTHAAPGFLLILAVPTEIQDLAGIPESTNPKPDRLVESHLFKKRKEGHLPSPSPCGSGEVLSLDIPLSKNSFKRESPRPGGQVWRLVFGVIGFVVGGVFPRSTQSLCPRMLDRTSACDRRVGRVDEP
jgi:hypothetical protein